MEEVAHISLAVGEVVGEAVAEGKKAGMEERLEKYSLLALMLF